MFACPGEENFEEMLESQELRRVGVGEGVKVLERVLPVPLRVAVLSVVELLLVKPGLWDMGFGVVGSGSVACPLLVVLGIGLWVCFGGVASEVARRLPLWSIIHVSIECG